MPLITNMNFLGINAINKVDLNELIFEAMSEECQGLLQKYFFDGDIDGDKGLAEEERIEIFNQVCSAKHAKLLSLSLSAAQISLPYITSFLCSPYLLPLC